MRAHVGAGENKIRISACTVVKNEAANIETSIRSYRDFVDEIIVVDTGSTDDTVKICESLGARVLHFQWCDDFAAAKNFALDAANGDWILFLDADEYFDEGCCAKVQWAVKMAMQQACDRVSCCMWNIDKNSGKVYSKFYPCRIFKAGLRYIFPIHEDLEFVGCRRIFQVAESEIKICHTGYSLCIEKAKSQRNLNILEKALNAEENPLRQAEYHAYMADCFLNLGRYDEAITSSKVYLECFRDRGRHKNNQWLKCYQNILRALSMLNAPYIEIDDWAEKALSEYPGHPDLLFEKGHLMQKFRLFQKAISLFTKAAIAADCYEDDSFCQIFGKMTDLHYSRGLCYEGLHHPAEALECYIKALDAADNAPASIRLASILKGLPKEETQDFIGSLLENAEQGKRLRVLAGLMCQYDEQQVAYFYSLYKLKSGDKTYDLDALGYIAAAKGNYKGAAGFFREAYKHDNSPDTAMRALLCADVSGDGFEIEESKKIAESVFARALEIGDRPDWTPETEEISSISKLVAEAGRMRGSSFAELLAGRIAAKLNPEDRKRFALALENFMEFAGALAVAKLDFTPESVFLQGYYAYRLGRPEEAQVLLEASKHMGCKDVALETLLELASAATARKPSFETDATAVKNASIKCIEGGDYEKALKLIRTYRRMAPADAESYSIESVACYQAGDYRMAAAAVEAGLLHGKDRFDLLYNGGEVYIKMELFPRALAMYRMALSVCEDKKMSVPVKQTIAKLETVVI